MDGLGAGFFVVCCFLFFCRFLVVVFVCGRVEIRLDYRTRDGCGSVEQPRGLHKGGGGWRSQAGG